MRKWNIVQMVVTVKKVGQKCLGDESWKKPFKKLKLSTIRAETETRLLLDVAPSELKKIQKLTDGRFQVENVMEPEEEEDSLPAP